MFEQGKVYTFGELQSLLKESATPKVGKGVVENNKSNNKEAVEKMLTDANKTVEQAKGEEKNVDPQGTIDINKTTLDARYSYEPSKEYKDRVEAQVHGFASKENEKNSDVNENEALDTDGNKKFYEERKDINKEMGERQEEEKEAGLKSQHLPKDIFKNRSAFSEGKSMKRLVFKNTQFLSEAQVINKVPDDYKYDGNKFVVMDKSGTEYLIECKKDQRIEEYIHVNVINKVNRQELKETFERMNQLVGYKSSDYMKKQTEGPSLSEMLDKTKNLFNKNQKDVYGRKVEQLDEALTKATQKGPEIFGMEGLTFQD